MNFAVWEEALPFPFIGRLVRQIECGAAGLNPTFFLKAWFGTWEIRQGCLDRAQGLAYILHPRGSCIEHRKLFS